MIVSQSRWRVASLVFSLYVLSSPFWIRSVADSLRDRGVLRLSLLSAVAVLVFYAILERAIRRRTIRWSRWLALALSLAGYAWVFWPGHLKAWEEVAHFVHLAVLSQLYIRAWGRWGLAVGLAGLVGMTEEIFQIWAPGRFFDWHDVRINLLATLLSGTLLYWRGSRP